MQISFDAFDLYDVPTFVLCQPNKTQLYALGTIFNRQMTLNYNAISTLSFEAHKFINGEEQEYYNYLDYKRLIYIPNIAYFMITGLQEIGNGIDTKKIITCESLEKEFAFKKMSLFTGTYKFYDIITSGSDTLLGYILTFAPNWSVGYVDPDLTNIYRTFDVKDTTIYDLLMTDVENAYQCIFSFDTINREISAYTVDNATTQTDIFLSFENLLKEFQYDLKTEELVTALNVFGAGDMNINLVNPLGTNTIYNFDYYKSTTWMSGSLIDAITSWENEVDIQQPIYANLLTQLLEANTELITEQGQLVDLQSAYNSLENILGTRIQEGTIDTSDIRAQMAAQQALIDAQNALIASTNTTIDNVSGSLTAINTSLSFENNFTQDELLDLSDYIFGSTYQNNNFIMTDTMTQVEIQNMAQDLYDQAKNILDYKLSIPRYEFTIDATNFVFVKDYEVFTNQLELGCVVTMDTGSLISYPVLLSISLNFDNPSEFSLIFSNRLRLDNGQMIFADLQQSSQKSSTNLNFNSPNYESFHTTWKDPVSEFISSSLNAATNNVVSSGSQDIIWNENGIRCRQVSGSGFLPTQMWIRNNMMAFTDDDWSHSRLALGQITTPSSGSAFGLVGDVIVGRIIAGNQLEISNQNNNFLLDSNGAVLNNASFTLTTNNNKNLITLDPTKGILIQKQTGSGIDNLLYLDLNGNLISNANGYFSGSIQASAGKIGSWTINNDGLYDIYGNYIYGNGNVHLGPLNIVGSTGTFSGQFYANNLIGLLYGSQLADGTITNAKIANISAAKITTDTMSADRLLGGTLRLGNNYNDPYGSISLNNNRTTVRGKYGLDLIGGNDTTINLDDTNGILLYSEKLVTIGSNFSTTKLNGSIQPSAGQYGKSTIVNAYYNGQNFQMTFIKGILTATTYHGSGSSPIDYPSDPIPSGSTIGNLGGWTYYWIYAGNSSLDWHRNYYCSGNNPNWTWDPYSSNKLDLPWCFAGMVVYCDDTTALSSVLFRYSSSLYNSMGQPKTFARMDTDGIMHYLNANGVTATGLTNTIMDQMWSALTSSQSLTLGVGFNVQGSDPTGTFISSTLSGTVNCDGTVIPSYQPWLWVGNPNGFDYDYIHAGIYTARKWILYVRPGSFSP